METDSDSDAETETEIQTQTPVKQHTIGGAFDPATDGTRIVDTTETDCADGQRSGVIAWWFR
ncbi:hypothetical protein OB955_10765 [Halobacteria archaeon AArc-m2/3/4]|uniref:Uncharacterized protein n=1 Tax=Natronoglomus mannanivorans TaxID=2979990 RepID=A0AAP3E1K2_9EURY|nr:hypothetical protein [Halobacteria archaeon AArc-xg1-1]MCU4973224.1 hypothetical protein [Halobacteria archaeon AArc-m2/3/4]